MENQLTIREAVIKNDMALFWEQLYSYYKRDMFPDPEDEDRAYFLGTEYRETMEKIHDRKEDRCYYILFYHEKQNVGFAMPVIYTSEDGKCFIMEYCIYPEFRGHGIGKECANILVAWAKEQGALYAELNYGSDAKRRHFWESVGFICNGVDEWGDPLMLLPPKEDIPIIIEPLNDPEDWQLKKLENGFLMENGDITTLEQKQEKLSEAMRNGKIIFFMAKRGYRAIGMCSVEISFSASFGTDIGIVDNFYIEPVFRKKGIAEKLMQAVKEWCRENDLKAIKITDVLMIK